MERIDQNVSTNPVKIIMQEMVTVCLVVAILKAESFPLQCRLSVEKICENLSKNNIEKEIAQNVLETSDQS
ncbi:hypothetical protein C2845_PM09G14420 [Panicum miliaceum]|uniref:Uncharacterized protein n=1 Tax=Panicum miliaceum TaxID=4540 RepID=A0A3L6S391_PANMI|nr:hypothetical protein C2845_PM09G14420 [Panicum miliaceum]